MVLLTAHFSASSGFGTVFDNRKAKKDTQKKKKKTKTKTQC
jgi:hypothetical protein